MFINITASQIGDNKGSSAALVNYLEKEKHLHIESGRGLALESWFNGTSNEISRQQVRVKIDRNIAKLSRNDAKFFLINVSPSQKELAFLHEKYGEQDAKEKLRAFAVKVIDEYAMNFKRPGIGSHKDLLWYGKLENYRYYKHDDKEVKDGTKQKGEQKEGRQMHVQIIVSRKDISNTVKLSPQNTSKGKNKSHSAKLGQFDRTAFKQSGESLFDSMFEFDRGLKDTLTYANTLKNGTAEQKAQMQVLKQNTGHKFHQAISRNLAEQIGIGNYKSIQELISTAAKAGVGLLEIMTEPSYESLQQNQYEDTEKRRKKRKQKQKSHGPGL
jgi:hypothetical protein